MSHRSSRRRGRTPSSRADRVDGRARVARGLCDDAAAQPDLLLLEQWASWLLGEIWKRRPVPSRRAAVDPMLVTGEPILDSLMDVGGAGGKTALLAMGGIERGALG